MTGAGHTRPIRLSANTRPRRSRLSVTGGAGAVFRTADGRSFTDLSSQTLNLLFGQAHPVVTEAVVTQVRKATFFDQDFDSPSDLAALHLLADLLPEHLLAFNLRMSNGSDAVESAVKQARRATGRSRVLTVDGIYLGQTNQGIHLRGWGEPPTDILRGSTEDVVRAPLPYCAEDDHDPADCPVENGEHLLRAIERDRDVLACVLLDPIMISSGVFGGRHGSMAILLRRVAEACRATGVPLVMDECQTFGWVPDHTLAAHWGLRPDAMVLGKGVAGGFPLAVCASTPELDNLQWGEADYTHGGHPASVAAMAATCGLLADPAEQDRFAELSRTLDELLVADHRGTTRTRGVGLIRALELLRDGRPADPALVRAVSDRCLGQGVYVRPYGSNLGLKPSRAMSPELLKSALEVVQDAIDAELAGV
ncbi:aminotransferase class III-fold pyridoxal phosphate-dependent enzyme [Kitasatospora purpeofusca]|uniref:Diaminobutyrate--2-oxoglutarate transaminase n=1 Tax=Kitasatospora purpeofusca TaxID=67352 RepID=A0ABZ1U5H7_9ACTN|nr:aminotransferase class III-fold pyridoxal phosphate-dependent enzyme [Kitasatospora purpeofusca]